MLPRIVCDYSYFRPVSFTQVKPYSGTPNTADTDEGLSSVLRKDSTSESLFASPVKGQLMSVFKSYQTPNTSPVIIVPSNRSGGDSPQLRIFGAALDSPGKKTNKMTLETRARMWASILTSEQSEPKLSVTDEEIMQVELDLHNQKVINADCQRSRINVLTDIHRIELEKIITLLCKKKNLHYKQGLHEIAAPFINFRKTHMGLAEIYTLVELFLDRFLSSVFGDKDFSSLKCCFEILDILLRYHDPFLGDFLQSNGYPPEIYCTSWFLTLFAHKLGLETLYHFWDAYILENDPYLVLYFSLAILLETKEQILNTDVYMIPQILAKLKIENTSQINQILKKAKELKSKTPLSFRNRLQELDIFKKTYLNQNNLKTVVQTSLEILEQAKYMLMSPFEIINALYSNELKCSNAQCSNYQPPRPKSDEPKSRKGSGNESEGKKSRKGSMNESEGRKSRKGSMNEPEVNDNDSEKTSRKGSGGSNGDAVINIEQVEDQIEKKLCTFCETGELPESVVQLANQIPYINTVISQPSEARQPLEFLILDFRTNKSDGVLPKSRSIDLPKMNLDDFASLIQELSELKNKVHFVFMSSHFSSADFKRYLEESMETRPRMRSVPTGQPGRKGNLDEDVLMFRFLEEFEKNEFNYISVIEGGFNEVNRLLHKTNSSVEGHNADTCNICNGPSRNRKTSLFDFFNKFFR